MDWRDAYDTAIIERNFAIINGQEWQARAEAAERRVQELEAQLAAQAWRPISEPPTEAGTYLLYDADGEPYLFSYRRVRPG